MHKYLWGFLALVGCRCDEPRIYPEVTLPPIPPTVESTTPIEPEEPPVADADVEDTLVEEPELEEPAPAPESLSIKDLRSLEGAWVSVPGEAPAELTFVFEKKRKEPVWVLTINAEGKTVCEIYDSTQTEKLQNTYVSWFVMSCTGAMFGRNPTLVRLEVSRTKEPSTIRIETGDYGVAAKRK